MAQPVSLPPRSASSAPAHASPRRARVLTGRDYAARGRAAVPDAVRSAYVLPIAIGVLASALALSALRNEIIDLRYGLARAQQTHQSLDREATRWQAAARRLRHPARLQPLAAEMGLVPVPRVVLGSEAPPGSVGR